MSEERKGFGVWYDQKEECLMIRNSSGDLIALPYVEGINLYRILDKSITLRNKMSIRIFGNKRFGKLII